MVTCPVAAPRRFYPYSERAQLANTEKQKGRN